jgi:hypothetical protein
LSKGLITPDQYDFAKATINGAKRSELQQMAENLISNIDDTLVTHDGKVPLSLLTPNDIQNWHGAMADQLASNLGNELNTSLTDHLTQRALYKIVSNKNMMDGLQGWVDHVDEKLSADKIDKIIKNAQSIKKSVKNLPLPKELRFKNILDEYESAYGARINDADLATRNDKLSLTSEMHQTLLARRQRDSDHTSSDTLNITYPSVAKEIDNISAKFETNDYQLTNQTSAEYARLRQLADYNKTALKLLRKVDLINEINRQQFY